MNSEQMKFLERAIELSRRGMESGKGGPFGCVIVKDGVIVGEGSNEVIISNDPTAHAEVVAIRNACMHLKTFQLEGCEVYTSCEPCPMCLGAIYWSRPAKVFYANTKKDAAAINFDDHFIYEEIEKEDSERKIPFEHQPHDAALAVFSDWQQMANKPAY